MGTQTSVESDEEEPDILELLKGAEKTFLNTLSIKKEYRAALPELRKLGDMETKKFLKNYAKFKVCVMDEY